MGFYCGPAPGNIDVMVGFRFKMRRPHWLVRLFWRAVHVLSDGELDYRWHARHRVRDIRAVHEPRPRLDNSDLNDLLRRAGRGPERAGEKYGATEVLT